MTHKQYNIKDQIPKFVELLLVKSKADLVLDEYCWDDWPYTLTIIENVDFHLRVIIQSYYRHNHLTSITHSNPNLQLFFSLNEDQMKCLKDYEIINITERLEEKEYRSDEDPTRTHSARKPHLLPLQLNVKWYENWPKTHSSMCVYKLIELVMFDEKSLLNKATNRILVSLSLWLSHRSGICSSSQWSSITKVQKMLYHRFHQKMICNIDRWIDRTLSSIRDEEKSFRKQVHSQQLLDSQKEQWAKMNWPINCGFDAALIGFILTCASEFEWHTDHHHCSALEECLSFALTWRDRVELTSFNRQEPFAVFTTSVAKSSGR